MPHTNAPARRYSASALIRGAMARDGLTQADLAAHLGVSRVGVSYRLNGETRWGISEVRTVAEVLDLDFHDLVDLIADEVPA